MQTMLTRGLGFLITALVLTASSVAASEPERISTQRLLSPQGISYESHLVPLQSGASGTHMTSPIQVRVQATAIEGLISNRTP